MPQWVWTSFHIKDIFSIYFCIDYIKKYDYRNSSGRFNLLSSVCHLIRACMLCILIRTSFTLFHHFNPLSNKKSISYGTDIFNQHSVNSFCHRLYSLFRKETNLYSKGTLYLPPSITLLRLVFISLVSALNLQYSSLTGRKILGKVVNRLVSVFNFSTDLT